VKIHTN